MREFWFLYPVVIRAWVVLGTIFSDAFLPRAIYSWVVLPIVSRGSPLVVERRALGRGCDGIVNSQRIYTLRWWGASVSLLLRVIVWFLFDDMMLIRFLLDVAL